MSPSKLKQRPPSLLSLAVLLLPFVWLMTFDAKGQARVKKESFGKTSDGQGVDIYTLTNSHGVEAKIMNYGGIVTSLKVPDRNGRLEDVVLGFDNLDAYLKGHPYFGAIIGRYGNRIAGGKFTPLAIDKPVDRQLGNVQGQQFPAAGGIPELNFPALVA